MKIKFPMFGEFWVNFLIGSLLVFLILVLGLSFFNAIYNTQIDSRREFLSKQSELAARGLEMEIRRFEEESRALIGYLEDPGHELDDYDEEFTSAARRLFNAFPSLIDSAWVDMQDSVLTFTFNERNDFFRKAVDTGFPESSSKKYSTLVIGRKGFRILYSLDFLEYVTDFSENYYLNPTGAKFLFFEDQITPLNRSQIQLSEEALRQVKEDLALGLKGMYDVNWSIDGEDFSGVVSQYPFRFNISNKTGAFVFVVPIESLSSGIYRTYFFLFLGFMILLVGTVGFFVVSLKNSLEFQRTQERNIKEIRDLFEQQILLLQELRGFVYFHNQRGEIIRVSEEVEGVLGYNQEEFTNAFQSNSTHEEANRIREIVLEKISQKLDVMDLEYDFFRRDGRKLRVRIFEKFVYDSDGNFLGGMGICTDITEQYQSQVKLQESENRLRNLIRSIPDIIFIYNNQGAILDIHLPEEAKELPELQKAIGKNYAEIFPKDQRADVKSAFENALKSRKIHSVEVALKDFGKDRFFENRYFPLDENQMMSISRDITGQKIWEKGLMEAIAAADKASRAKSEFLANMSHEIRTPMNGLLGIIDLLEQTKLDKIQKQYVDIIKNSGNTLLGIIKDILDYSKIEAGKVEILPEVFDPFEELENQCKIFLGLASKKNIQFSFQKGFDESLLIEADKFKINQVFLNLVGNAVKFTPEGGSVKVEVNFSPISEETGFLECSVEDTGIGISEDHLQHLSDPFYQIDSSNTRSHQGTGLGLAIAKKLTELMGGEFEVTSELGKGSKFEFSVLVKKVSSREDSETSKDISWADIRKSSGKYPFKVLLIEDNDLNLQLMGMMLDQLGFTYEVARNGEESLEKVKTGNFDILLMDVQMPVMNGLEATRIIRKMDLSKQPIIIGLSANVFDDDKLAAIESGMDDYLTKPIRLGILAERLEHHFQKIK
ncbi:PAS domain-containing hybrid sensor histidine kinase/response regulator [Algoriphagus limi]|uniref:histidine kinase n=1 Tax=Algoriphagus limi TaxID=2975273 RepID=A0ABT2G374_9BACT|nr:PAS domain-containing hybrid sensor histidine kinase/response regulator [Algoriphagus limi]MCS5489690.1 ATP-binding protein [Algoriphagus limi]